VPAVRNVGVDWRLRLYPGGVDNIPPGNSSRRGWVAILIVNRSNKSIEIGCGFSIKDGKGKQVANKQSVTHATLAPVGAVNYSSCIWHNFVERSTIIDSLVDGTLVVEVHLKSLTPSNAALPRFTPENPFCKNILQLFNDKESADIIFEVGKHQSKNNAAKVAKIAPVTFHAHCLILNNAGSTILAELCNSKGDPTTPIEITDVSPEVFRHLLYYIYGGKISDDEMKTHTKDN
jgi:hypothetical protein